MIELDAELDVSSLNKVDYKKTSIINDNSDTKLFKIAYKIGNKQMLKILLLSKVNNRSKSSTIPDTYRAMNII